MRVAMLGTRGVPARYGGFETCVDEVGARLCAAGHEVTVYCRPGEPETPVPATHREMRLVHVPALRQRSLETLSHTAASVLHTITRRRRPDVVLLFNAANAVMIPALRARGIPVATHVDGLEWQRAKWGPVGRRYYRWAESLAVRWSDALIADALGIQSYYRDEFGAASDLISYGAPTVRPRDPARLGEVGVTAGSYHLVVARFEPENNVETIVAGYRRSRARLPLVIVGGAPYAADYTKRVHRAADDRVVFVGSVWDQELLDELYANATTYVHGHSVGGTNPSLLRAIGARAATLAFDVSFNREVLDDAGWFWSDESVLAALFERAEADAAGLEQLAQRSGLRAGRYEWDDVAMAYERLCLRLSGGDADVVRLSGRRARLTPVPTRAAHGG